MLLVLCVAWCRRLLLEPLIHLTISEVVPPDVRAILQVSLCLFYKESTIASSRHFCLIPSTSEMLFRCLRNFNFHCDNSDSEIRLTCEWNHRRRDVVWKRWYSTFNKSHIFSSGMTVNLSWSRQFYYNKKIAFCAKKIIRVFIKSWQFIGLDSIFYIWKVSCQILILLLFVTVVPAKFGKT
jgi:hypothetical protein